MILTTAAILVGAGILLFAMGFVLSRPELAMFGAIIVIAAGAAGVAAGYEVQVGETEQTTTTNKTVALEDIGGSSLEATNDVSQQEDSPTGVDFSVDGRHMFLTGLDNGSVHAYDSGGFDLTLASARASYNVSAQDAAPTDVAVVGSGSWMYVLGSDTGAMYLYRLSEPYNVTTAGLEHSAQLPEVSDPQALEPVEDGEKAVVADGAGLLHDYSLAGPHNASSVSHGGSVDVRAQEKTPAGFGFSDDGTRMVLTGSQSDAVFQYDLGTAYDVGTASYTGRFLDLSGEVNRPSAVAYDDDGRSTFVTDQQSAELMNYDSSTTRSSEETSRKAVYDNVELPAGFPLGAVVLLLGTVMLMSSAGKASENGLGDNN